MALPANVTNPGSVNVADQAFDGLPTNVPAGTTSGGENIESIGPPGPPGPAGPTGPGSIQLTTFRILTAPRLVSIKHFVPPGYVGVLIGSQSIVDSDFHDIDITTIPFTPVADDFVEIRAEMSTDDIDISAGILYVTPA